MKIDCKKFKINIQNQEFLNIFWKINFKNFHTLDQISKTDQNFQKELSIKDDAWDFDSDRSLVWSLEVIRPNRFTLVWRLRELFLNKTLVDA